MMADDASLLIIYDGECPFCSAYAQMVRLKETFGDVQLINARSAHPVMQEIHARGLDPDRGIIMKWRHTFLQADEAMHFLAISSTSSGAFNRLNRLLFCSPRVGRILYPFLYRGRNLLLRLMGRKRLS